MSMSFEINLNGQLALIKKLEGATQESVITRSMDQGGILLAGWSKKNRLSGPRPNILGVVTGRLRSSISSSKTVKEGNQYLTKIGTNVSYARVHEFGFAKRNLKARPFLGPSIEDRNNQSSILGIFTKNINEALEKK